MPVHGADRLYIGDQLIVGGKCEITETYQPGFGERINVYKQGYKIKQIEEQLEFSYSGSARGKPQILVDDNNNGSYNYILVTCCQCGNQRGYNYGEGLTYGGLREWKNSNTIVSFDSGWTTKSNGAFNVIYSKNSVSYKVGKYYGTWLGQGTANYNTTYQNAVNYLFTSQLTNITRDNGGMNNVATWTKYNVIITYEPA